MPKLAVSNIIEVTLPSSTPDDPAVVKFDATLTTRQALDIASTEDKTQAMVELLASCIREWNFTDADDQPEPITAEAVGKLQIDDFALLAEKISEAVDETIAKKKVGDSEKKA